MPDGSVVEAIAINHVSITSNPVSNHRSSLSNSLKGTSSIKDKDQIKVPLRFHLMTIYWISL